MIKYKDKSPRKTLSKIQKLALEGKDKEIIEKEVKDILDQKEFINSEKFEEQTFIHIDDVLEALEYKKNEDLCYELDSNDSLVKCLCMASYF